MTLFLLLFGTLSDIFIVRATWPLVRYKNGTVAVTNDGGTVRIQSTDLVVDGNLSVSGSLFVHDGNTMTSVISQLRSLSPPKCMRPSGTGLFFNGTSWICECVQNSTHVYYGTSCESLCAVNATQFWDTTASSCREKTSTFTTIGGKELYKEDDGWILLLAYKHTAGENNELVFGIAPTSPTEGYSHIWIEDLGLVASDVDSVRFFCTSSSHSRVMHFSVNNDWIKSAIVTGSASGNSILYWTSGTMKFSDHTANIPDKANAIFSESDLLKFPFYYNDSPNSLLYGIRAYGHRFACDDYPTFNGDRTGYQYNNLFQIWFKRKQ